jgi:hypothetical protein
MEEQYNNLSIICEFVGSFYKITKFVHGFSLSSHNKPVATVVTYLSQFIQRITELQIQAPWHTFNSSIAPSEYYRPLIVGRNLHHQNCYGRFMLTRITAQEIDLL